MPSSKIARHSHQRVRWHSIYLPEIRSLFFSSSAAVSTLLPCPLRQTASAAIDTLKCGIVLQVTLHHATPRHAIVRLLTLTPYTKYPYSLRSQRTLQPCIRSCHAAPMRPNAKRSRLPKCILTTFPSYLNKYPFIAVPTLYGIHNNFNVNLHNATADTSPRARAAQTLSAFNLISIQTSVTCALW